VRKILGIFQVCDFAFLYLKGYYSLQYSNKVRQCWWMEGNEVSHCSIAEDSVLAGC
jgi:hypothetical protein